VHCVLCFAFERECREFVKRDRVSLTIQKIYNEMMILEIKSISATIKYITLSRLVNHFISTIIVIFYFIMDVKCIWYYCDTIKCFNGAIHGSRIQFAHNDII